MAPTPELCRHREWAAKDAEYKRQLGEYNRERSARLLAWRVESRLRREEAEKAEAERRSREQEAREQRKQARKGKGVGTMPRTRP